MISVVIADDHPALRMGVRALLEAEPDLRVVAEVAVGEQVVEVVRDKRPDVLVLDIELTDVGGLDVLRRLRQAGTETRVLVFSVHGDRSCVLAAIRMGAVGYLLKGTTATELREAVRRVAAGDHYMSPSLAEMVIDAYARGSDAAEAGTHDTLTGREREVLQLTAVGLTHHEVGRRLGISPRTVEAHRARLLRKLGLRSQTDLVRYAIGRGIIKGDQAVD